MALGPGACATAIGYGAEMSPRPVPANVCFAVSHQHRARGRSARRRLALLAVAPFLLTSCVTRADTAWQQSDHGDHGDHGSGVRLRPSSTAITGSATAAIPARSFVAGIDQRDRLRATLCLASAIYYEAATEPDDGQRAVAQVVLNRVRHRAWPHTVCGVVYQGSSAPGCQFSFACDGAMGRGPMLPAWIRARRVAEAALAGAVFAPVGNATFYHTLRVAPPWRLRMISTGIIGAHIFYRLPGDEGALPSDYAGREPAPGPLPSVIRLASSIGPALPAPAIVPVTADRADVGARRSPQYPEPTVRSDDNYLPGVMPDSTIRPEYRDSGKWIGG